MSEFVGPRCKRCRTGPDWQDGYCSPCWYGLGSIRRAKLDAELEEIANVDWDAAMARLNAREAGQP